MRLGLILGGIVALAVAGFAAYVRFAQSDPAIWHVDPRSVTRRAARGSFLLRGTAQQDENGASAPDPRDGPAPRFPGTPPRCWENSTRWHWPPRG